MENFFYRITGIAVVLGGLGILTLLATLDAYFKKKEKK